MTTTSKVKIKPRPAVAATAPVVAKTAGVKIKASAKPAVVIPPAADKGARKATASAPMPEITVNYDGASGLVNRNKSRTVVRHAEFGRLAGAKRTGRDEAFLAGIRGKFGNQPFPRMRLDAGFLNRAIARGLVQPMSGEGVAETDTYRLTKEAFPKQAV